MKIEEHEIERQTELSVSEKGNDFKFDQKATQFVWHVSKN